MAPVPRPGRALPVLRICARSGCSNLVKKQTAKYCSVRCSAEDPDRRARLSRRAKDGRLLPLARQLPLAFDTDELAIGKAAESREEIPQGLSRWAV